MNEEDEMVSLQSRVNKLFLETLVTEETNFNLSYPLIPRISNEYLKNRIVIVGQETNTWYNDKSENGDYNDIFLHSKNIYDIEKEALNKRYDIFVNEAVENYGGKFWEFNRLLYQEQIIKGSIVKNNELSHCWINLFCMEACYDKKDTTGRPTKNQSLRNNILNHQKLLTYNLLKLLEPKLIIFLTGNSLDNVLLQYALNGHKASSKPIDNRNILEEKHACEIIPTSGSALHNSTIIRLYHPTYFMGYINGNRQLKIKMDRNNFDRSISSYYLSVVLSFLKKWKQSN